MFERSALPAGTAIDAATAGVAALAEVSWGDEPVAGMTGHLHELLALQAKLDAQIVAPVGAVDATGAAELDGAGSTAAWLRWQGRLPPGLATATVTSARRLRDLDETAKALAAGEISAPTCR